MNLTNSWMVNVDFSIKTAKSLHTMLKTCAGAIKYSPLYKESSIFLCMHHYLEISEEGIVWTRGRNIMR